MTDDELIKEIEAQRGLMVAVATGGPRVDRGVQELRLRLEQAHTEEQYQAIGLLRVCSGYV